MIMLDYLNCDSRWLDVVDYRLIDYVCIKFNQHKEKTITVYCLEANDLYDEMISCEDRMLVSKCKDLGCYGNSELIYDGKSESQKDKFYVRLNIVDAEQYKKVIREFNNYIEMTHEQLELLRTINHTTNKYMQKGDYQALYYCGFIKNKKSQEYDCIRFYYQITEDKTRKIGADVFNDLAGYKEISEDPAFRSAEELIKNSLAVLRCIGIEFDRAGSYRVKYFVEPVSDTVLNELRLSGFWFEGNSFSTMCRDCRLEKVDLVQISSGFKQKETTVGFYIKPYETPDYYYSIREGIVARNIGGVFFLVDIHNKDYYNNKTLDRINRTGYEIVKIIQNRKLCNTVAIMSDFLELLKEYDQSLKRCIEKDIQSFIQQLENKGYVIKYPK